MVEDCLPLKPLPTPVSEFQVALRLFVPTSRFLPRRGRRQDTHMQLTHHPNPLHSATSALCQVGRYFPRLGILGCWNLLSVLYQCLNSNFLSSYFFFLSVGSFSPSPLLLIIKHGGYVVIVLSLDVVVVAVTVSVVLSRWCLLVIVSGGWSCCCVLCWMWPCRGGQEWHQEASQPVESVRPRHRPVRARWGVGGATVPSGGRQ